MISDIEKRRKQLLYRATYRGFKEADIVVGGFARAHLADMDMEQLDAFAELLEVNDRQLYAWIMGNTPEPAEFAGPVLEEMKKFRPSLDS